MNVALQKRFLNLNGGVKLCKQLTLMSYFAKVILNQNESFEVMQIGLCKLQIAISFQSATVAMYICILTDVIGSGGSEI